MVKYLLLTLVLLFCEIAVAQQRVKITGTVCDMQTKKPVEGVNVTFRIFPAGLFMDTTLHRETDLFRFLAKLDRIH